jgi:hypothetical protein
MFKQNKFVKAPTYDANQYKLGIAERLDEIAREVIENNFDLIKKYSCLEISTRVQHELGINAFTSSGYGPNKPNYLSEEVLRELTDYIIDDDLRMRLLGLPEFQSEFWHIRLQDVINSIWANEIDESRKDQLMMNAVRITDKRPAYDYINRIKSLQLLLDAGYDEDQLCVYVNTVEYMYHKYTIVPTRAHELVLEKSLFQYRGTAKECYEYLIKSAHKAEQDANKFISEHTLDDCMRGMYDAVKSCYENMMLTFTHLQSMDDRNAYFREMSEAAGRYEKFAGYLGCFENAPMSSDKIEQTRVALNSLVRSCEGAGAYVGFITRYLKEEQPTV